MKKTLFLFVTLVSMSASLLCLFLFVSCKQEGESKVEYIRSFLRKWGTAPC